jgi:hypothetical protein
MFPKKITFKNLKHRTAKVNDSFSSHLPDKQEIIGQKKGQKTSENLLPHKGWTFRTYVTPYSVAKLTTCLLAKKCSPTFRSVTKGNYLPISI